MTEKSTADEFDAKVQRRQSVPTGLDRRAFLGATAATGLFQSALAKALATPAARRTGSIMDVEHVVLFMQENRSFDHYFGTLSGARGFADPHPVTLPDGNPVWHQPGANGARTAPFLIESEKTNFPVHRSLDHGWATGHDAWNQGRYDRWLPAKSALTMGYLARPDLPFHFALADAFTLCDDYFCSVKGGTVPNRLYYMTGNVDHHNRGGHGPVIGNIDITQRPDGVVFGTGWETYAEALQDAGVTWQMYRQGDDDSDDNSDGGMNTLLAFERFRSAKPGEPLYERGVRPRRLEQLKKDVQSGNLAQVSWIVPPRLFCEHPNWPPAYGAQYLARIMDALTSNPDVWSKTVFIVMYDENDGYFDHVVPPTPPLSPAQGLSTVSIEDERYSPTGEPYGLGIRVPLLAISPWSKGGWICSETFDHTSTLQFLEKRFGVRANNISPWRRAICGDLTSAFDFSLPAVAVPRALTPIPAEAKLPDQAVFNSFKSEVNQRPEPSIPTAPQTPWIESGIRHSRPLGYRLEVTADAENGSLVVNFINRGRLGAHFHLVDRTRPDTEPRRYTVEAGKSLTDRWAQVDGRYSIIIHGPSGYVWWADGNVEKDLRCKAQPTPTNAIRIAVTNAQGSTDTCTIIDRYHAAETPVKVHSQTEFSREFDLSKSGGWYDLEISSGQWRRRFAGRVETGRHSITDPAMAKFARNQKRN